MNRAVLNALSVDVEEYFHVHAFDRVIDPADWDRHESRVEASTALLLDILAATGTRATFFILGWVAERRPALVRRIQGAGHEIATHGYGHRLVYQQTPAAFRADVLRSIDVLQQITGDRVLGYRAPSFSITARSLWALDVLAECGLAYDSSIYPARPLVHARWGMPGARLEPHLIRPTLWEFPMSVVRWARWSLPVSGGGSLRHYPLAVTRWGLCAVNAQGRPAMLYLHPWEADPEQPRVRVGLWRSFLHYRNLHRTAARLEALCREFCFAPVREVLGL